MKTLFNPLKQEFKYLYFSKTLYLTALFVVLSMLLVLYFNTQNLFRHHTHFIESKVTYEARGIDYQAALKEELNVTKETLSDGSVITSSDNAIRSSFEEVGKDILIIRPGYLLHHELEVFAFLFGPIIFGIYGAYCAHYDRKYRTMKLKASNSPWHTYILAKQLTQVIGIFLILLSASIVMLAVSKINLYFVSQSVDIQYFAVAPLSLSSSIFTKFFVCLTTSCLFSLIGFTLATASKTLMVPVLLLGAYNTVIPNLGPYDIKNIFSVIGSEVFEFHSTLFHIFRPHPLSLLVAIGILFTLFILFIAFSPFITRYQSKYI